MSVTIVSYQQLSISTFISHEVIAVPHTIFGPTTEFSWPTVVSHPPDVYCRHTGLRWWPHPLSISMTIDQTSPGVNVVLWGSSALTFPTYQYSRCAHTVEFLGWGWFRCHCSLWSRRGISAPVEAVTRSKTRPCFMRRGQTYRFRWLAS